MGKILMLRFVILLLLAFTTQAYAQVNDKKKCVACVTKEQRASVQKKLDDLRARVKDLEDENRTLRNRPIAEIPVASNPVQRAYAALEKPRVKKNRLSGLIGYGPQSLDNDRETVGSKISVEHGPLLGAQYQRLMGETVSVGVGATVPTYAKTKRPSWIGSLGVDF
jgi:cell division protein FtsB